MDRRNFLQTGLSAAAAALASRADGAAPPDRRPRVAITIDDFNISDTPALSGETRHQALLDALDRHRLKAAGFVTGRNIDEEKKLALLRLWDERGHLIANHTYSHLNYAETEFELYARDILRNEALLKQFSHFRRFLRFPFLKEGQTAPHRDRMRAFLKEHGYRNGHVTIDASDWYIDGRLNARLKKDPTADPTPYRDFYLQHIWERASYYDDLARKVVGRSISHTLLIHHNALNGLFLDDLLQMFVGRGWGLIDADQAYTDPVFLREPKVLPAGESLIWSLAKESGKFASTLRYPAEDGRYEKPRMDALGL